MRQLAVQKKLMLGMRKQHFARREHSLWKTTEIKKGKGLVHIWQNDSCLFVLLFLVVHVFPFSPVFPVVHGLPAFPDLNFLCASGKNMRNRNNRKNRTRM